MDFEEEAGSQCICLYHLAMSQAWEGTQGAASAGPLWPEGAGGTGSPKWVALVPGPFGLPWGEAWAMGSVWGNSGDSGSEQSLETLECGALGGGISIYMAPSALVLNPGSLASYPSLSVPLEGWTGAFLFLSPPALLSHALQPDSSPHSNLSCPNA